MELQPCSRFEWERIIRRCTLPGAVKLLAYTLAQYGDQSGHDIRPGTPRLAAVCGMATRVVDRHLATLREVGLIERVSNGGGRNRLAAVYRLTVPDDLLERLDLLPPDELTPASTVAGVVPIRPVDNSTTPAAQVAGVVDPAGTELPPLSNELPPKRPRTPANDPPVTCDNAQHHNTTQTTPPSRSLESLSHLHDPIADAQGHDPPPGPDAERQRQQAALAAWTTDHPDTTRETA